jgi:hypothetical protein
MTMRVLFAALTLVLCEPLPSPAQDASIAVAYSQLSLRLPTAASVVICHGFGCALRAEIALGKADHKKLAALLAPGKKSPEAERRAVAAATAWFDRRVGPAAGTTGRVARAGGFTESGPGQMDCIDTSRNTTSLLLILDRLQLLRHHQVEAPVARGFLLDIRGPHATAVLSEVKSGQKWSFDAWTRKYGEQAEVMPLQKWMAER